MFVAYEIELTANGHTWSVLKRYSSIHDYVQKVKATMADRREAARVGATFPPKVLGKVNVEERRLGLEWFLRVFLREAKVGLGGLGLGSASASSGSSVSSFGKQRWVWEC